MLIPRIKKLKVITNVIVVTLIGFFIIGGVAEAATFGGGRVNNAKPLAFYHSSVSSYGYTANYDAGRAYWNAHSKVDIRKSTGSSGADRYYIGNTSVTGLLGVMTPYTLTGTVASVNSNWAYTTVYMYDNTMRSTGSNTNARRNYNAAHEIGHSIKMAHVPLPTNSVMVQGWRDIPSGLTSFDRGEIDKKW